jgi:hypothetical protein
VPSALHTHGKGCSLWLTPTANDSKPAGPREMEMMRLYLTGQSVSDTYKRLRSQLAAVTGLRLPANPAFLEWLMGYPTGHTEIGHSETP